MRLSAARSLPTQGWMRARFDAIGWAADAEALLAGLDRRKRFAILLLPHHACIQSDTKAGIRSVDAYLTWSTGSVIAVPQGGSVCAKWHVVEHGQRRSGTSRFSIGDDNIAHVDGVYPDAADQPLLVGTERARDYPAMLGSLRERAQRSQWELLLALEHHVVVTLAAANRRVARELEGDLDYDVIDLYVDRSNHGAVDQVSLEKLSSELLFGDDGGNDTSVVMRLVRRCATTAINQQPIPAYLAANIFSAAEEAIRREIKDPHIGRKVRRVARSLRGANFEDVIAEYRKVHPKDELGRRRALAALSAGKTIDSTASSLSILLAEHSAEAVGSDEEAVYLGLTLRALAKRIGTTDASALRVAYQHATHGTGDGADLDENELVAAWAATSPDRSGASA